MAAQELETRFDWRRGWAAFGALLATLVLLMMVALVAMSNNARDQALERERHAYDVTLLVRTVDASIARSEAALGRFVLDEQINLSGSIYANEWRLAGYQIQQLEQLVRRDPAQSARVAELSALYRSRGDQLAQAARAAASGKGEGGISLFYAASRSGRGPGPELRAKLSQIANSERQALRATMKQTEFFSAEADRLTDYLSWLGLIVGLAAIGLSLVVLQAIRQSLASRQEADWLENAVAWRTQELSDANAALKAEAEERASAEAQLRQAQKMEAVGQLTGGIAHDFNNMLAVVVGGIDLARRRINGPRPEILLHLNNALEGATRAAALTRRLLSFSRNEPLLPSQVDPGELVSGMTDMLDRTLGERIEIAVDVAPAAWPIFVDPHQLENAIVNLAVNARDAMDGQGRMTVAVENVSLGDSQIGNLGAGSYVRVAVSDTGCGMTQEVLDRAFEPFFTTEEVGKGTGLGLSQIFGFARQSGGEIGIDSVVGEGTTVALYLPRALLSSAEVRLHPTAMARELVEPRVADARILLVEDDSRVRTATIGALQDLHYDPIAVGSGAEAIAAFEQQTFDLVISDVIMPSMTGPEMVRELKRRRPNTAILFVTGYVGEGEGEDLVGYELLRKPFTVAALADAVAAALGRTAAAA